MKMMLAGMLVSVAVADTGLAQQVDAPRRPIDCYCTDTVGERRELGEEICLFVDGRAYLARCEMSLNTTMWRETAEGCPGASLVSDDDVGRVLLK